MLLGNLLVEVMLLRWPITSWSRWCARSHQTTSWSRSSAQPFEHFYFEESTIIYEQIVHSISFPKQYLSFSTLDKIDCGCWIILQLCFANNAWLKQAKSLNPSPLIFAWHKLLQFAQWMPFCSFFDPHQNWAMALLMSSHTVMGILNTLIAWVSTAWATALIKISLPPLENNLSPWTRTDDMGFWQAREVCC